MLMRRSGMPGVIEVTGRTTLGGAEVVQGRSDEVSLGFSGAPVWDGETGLVLGMVTAVSEAGRDPAGKQLLTCYFRPVEVLRSVDAALALPSGKPYRGLDAFREEDHEWYFGRERAIGSLFDLLELNDLVGLVGVSGSGKSSLLRAGLERGLRDGRRASLARRQRIIFRPDRAPVAALRHALKLANVEVAALENAARDAATGDGQLLVVDQAERLFIECRSEDQRNRFLDLLVAISGDEIKVVVCLRADFFGALLQHGRMAVGIDRAHMTLLPMDSDELRSAIVAPATQLARAFDGGLDDQIIADVQGRAGDLPLLQFALAELWRCDAGTGVLTKDSYERLGKVAGAISVHADRVWAGLSREERSAGTRVIVSLISVGATTVGTGLDLAVGRQASPREWGTLEGEVAELLIDERLLTASQDPVTRERLVGVSHEALLRGWERARKWSILHGSYVRWYERELEPFLRRWQDGDERADLLLPSSSLPDARSRLAEAPDLISGPARRYIDESMQHSKFEERRRVEEQNRLLRALDDARREREMAVSRWLAAESTSAVEADPKLLPRSALLAVESLVQRRTLEGDAALRRALALLPRPIARFPARYGAKRVAMSGDGSVVVAVDAVGILNVIARPLIPGDSTVAAVDLPDRATAVGLDRSGCRMVVGGQGYVYLTDGETREGSLFYTTAWVQAVAVSSDGHRVAISQGNTATVFDWATLSRRAADSETRSRSAQLGDGVLFSHEDEVLDVALDAHGEHLATASRDGAATVWQVASATEPLRQSRHAEGRSAVEAVALDDGARVLLSGDRGGRARCVATTDGELLADVIYDRHSAITSVALTEAGDRSVIASDNGTARIIATATHSEAARVCVKGEITDVAMTADGALLATACRESQIREDGGLETNGEIALWDPTPYTTAAEIDVGAEGLCRFGLDGRLWIATDGGSVATLGDVAPLARKHYGRVLALDAVEAEVAIADEAGISFERAGVRMPWGVRGIVRASVTASAKRAAGVQLIEDETGRTEFHVVVRCMDSAEPLMAMPVDAVVAIAIDGSGSRVAAAILSRHGEAVGRAVVWDVMSGDMIAEFERNHIYAVALSPDGSRLAMTSHGTLIVRRLDESDDDHTLLHDGQFLIGVALTPDGASAATCSREGHVTVWDLEAGREVCRLRHDAPLIHITISPDRRWLASLTVDGIVRLWALDPAELIAEAGRRLTRNLTIEEWRRYFDAEPYRPTIPILAWGELAQRGA